MVSLFSSSKDYPFDLATDKFFCWEMVSRASYQNEGWRALKEMNVMSANPVWSLECCKNWGFLSPQGNPFSSSDVEEIREKRIVPSLSYGFVHRCVEGELLASCPEQ